MDQSFYAARTDFDIENNDNNCVMKKTVLPGCNIDFDLQCHTKINNNKRLNINQTFWTKSLQERRIFIKSNVSTKTIFRKRPRCGDKSRRFNFEYSFIDELHARQIVCKVFFLSTLGYKDSTDRFVRDCFVQNADLKDKRGSYNKKAKFMDQEQEVTNHILKFNPQQSHYRRDHAPLRLYLPSDVSASSMFKMYVESSPNT